MSEQMKVFSYWSGELPKKSILHFTSFRRLNPSIEYTLFLESDQMHEGKISKEMKEILNDLRIAIRPTSSMEVSQDENSHKMLVTKFIYKYRIFRKFRNLILQLFWTPIGKICFKLGLRKFGQIYFHPIFGSTPGRFSYLTVSHDNLAFKSDIFRIQKIINYAKVDALYLDLDIFVNIDLLSLPRERSFVFRWEDYGFANNAAIYVSEKDEKFRAYLKKYMLSKRPLQGWFIFPGDILDIYDVDILNTSMSDPFWAKSFNDYQKPQDFFIKSNQSQSNFASLLADFQFVHWHNNWQTEIEKGSLFDLCCEFVGIDLKEYPLAID